MTPQEFAAKIKAKYPQYKNVDDAELTQKVIAKYPVYASQIKTPEAPKTDVLQKTGNIVNKIFPGKQVGEAIGTLVGMTKANFEGTGEFYDLSAPTPTQVAGDIARGAATVAGAKLPIAETIGGKVAQFGVLGATGNAGEAIAEGKNQDQVLESAAKGALVGGATGAAFGIAEKGFKALGNFLGKTGDRIQTSVIKPSQADIKDGFSIETIKKHNLGGSLKQSFEKTDTTLDGLTKQLNSKLKESNASLDLGKVYENTTKKLLGNKLESFGSNTQMEGAIEKLREEISAVAGKNGLVSIPEAQLVKRASGHFGAWTYGVSTPEATASQKVYNTFYNELKTAIENSSPEGVKEINKQISELIPVMNALIRRIPVAERNSALSLTDIISLTGAALEPRALSISLLNLASKSGKVGAALGKNAPKAGQVVSDLAQKTEPVARTLISR